MACNESLSFSNASIGSCHRPKGHRGQHKAKLIGTDVTIKWKNIR